MIIDDLREFCKENNITFILGNQAYVNAIVDSEEYEVNELLLICDFNNSFGIFGSTIINDTYPGVLSLGRKKESSLDEGITESSLDETYIQKYDRRLSYLHNELKSILRRFTCQYEYTLQSINTRLDINQYDLNIDCVGCIITFLKD